jgi:hypothetical protein
MDPSAALAAKPLRGGGFDDFEDVYRAMMLMCIEQCGSNVTDVAVEAE